MTVERSRVGWRFWLLWMLASAVGWFLGLVVGPVGPFGGLNVADFQLALAGTASGAAVGAGVGIFQWLVLRRRVSRSGWWVLASTVGLAVAGVLEMAVASAGVYWHPERPVGLVVWMVGGTMAGIMQWLVLRGQVSRAGWWVLASTVGWGVSAAIMWKGVEVALGRAMGFLPVAVSLLAGGVGLGAITGLGLVWLLRQPAKEA